MESPELLLVCGVAFLWVFSILLVLAVLMRLIMLIFPEKRAGSDAAVLAALNVVYRSVAPGTRITKVEEKK